ncbi:acyl-CoA thioester hydrolase/BAAT C-terminal domain-containing protein [Nocardioides sp. Root140]|uniref:acyl-CoA thioester hydrolase/BAAT C-terminal domain-containing protein n=1 Tax=Nocardioides sp. Root140 TaxID=1736460 RepID=UPI0006F90AAF|nr:acyl-CoA thioester hydrolase/BAAT C-terminal domain-containing protein [Nocardioides sp. Root140]KQY64571.1 hypothetical protein ASD30_06530 [Nocardioides sp. Root140]
MTHTELGLLVLSGSSGRLETQRCEVLRSHGIAAEPVQWFGGPGQPATPRRIPLETFREPLDRLAGQARRIGVLGTSFGAEAALLLAIRDIRISAVVALSPTSVVWETSDMVDDRPVHDAKWTWHGEPLPGVPYVEQAGRDLADTCALHEASLAELNGQRDEVTIPVEKIDADVLVAAGGDDRVWPASRFCEEIVSRRSRHGQDTTYVFHPKAGHRVVLPGEVAPLPRADLPPGGTTAAEREHGEQVLDALLALAR